MDLEERIARLIDPDAWRHWDECTQVWPNPYARPGGAFVADSREAALRVIDGLNLYIFSSYHSLDGRRHRYDLSGFIREDM